LSRSRVIQAADEQYADRVKRQLASVAGWALEERIPYDCPWDDFRFNCFRGKDDWTVARELGVWADSQGIEVDFEERLDGDVEVIYVVLMAS
jgi:hypothetical protein